MNREILFVRYFVTSCHEFQFPRFRIETVRDDTPELLDELEDSDKRGDIIPFLLS